MEHPEARLAELGTSVRELLACEGTASREVRQTRADFLERIAARNAETAGSPFGWRVVLFASALAVAAVAVGIWTRQPLSFRVGVATANGRPGDLVRGTTNAQLPLRFSDGTSLLLHENGRLRVLDTTAKGARILVEDGTLDVEVAPSRLRGKQWVFEAGPLSVLVTGTKFKLAFRALDQTFGLATAEGQVVVSGTCVNGPIAVAAGSRLDVSCPANQPKPPEIAHGSLLLPSEHGSATPSPRPPAPEDAIADWRRVMAADRLQEGLRAADRVGFARVCQTATAKELLVLADAARLYDHPAQAVTALSILRQRFPSAAEAATAAFALGRIAFEHRHAYQEAARWFATYLREQPTGPLMGDAVGRLMEAKLVAGDHVGAREDAERYLRRFPAGPYAAEARGIRSW